MMDDTHLSPCNHSRLQNYLRFDTEILRLPEDEVSQHSDRDLSDKVANAMGDCTGILCSERRMRNDADDAHVFIVYLEMYRLTRPLSTPSISPSDVSGPLNSRILLAVRHVRLTTSPTRPIACESDEIIEIAPMSCSTSSAATVSARMRDSANDRSSAIDLSRW